MFNGRMRVYFNRHGAFPLVWCIAIDGITPGWELAVAAIHFDDVSMTAVYQPKDTDDADDGKPSAWFEVCGALRVNGPLATITAWEEGSR